MYIGVPAMTPDCVMLASSAARARPKALAKRTSERYSTARDLADDLRHFLHTEAATGLSATTPGPVNPPPGSSQDSTSDAPVIRSRPPCQSEGRKPSSLLHSGGR